MKRAIVLAALLASVATVAAIAQEAPGGADPFQWLEEIHGAKALAWVEQQNQRTAGRLETDPRYETFRKQALALFTAEDRIPTPEFRADGVDNVWQSAANPHGLWRHTTLASYRTANPQWTTLIDLDALSKAEGKSWFFKGATCLHPSERLCLVHLSNGGGDAVTIREFDTETRQFVKGGLELPVGKQNVDWLGPNRWIAARDWSGTGQDVTKSGYAYIVKTIDRAHMDAPGQEVFRGDPKEVRAGARVLRGPDGSPKAILFDRGVTFFRSRYYLQTSGEPKLIPLPAKTSVEGLVSGQLIFNIKEDWQGYKSGSVLSYDLAALLADGPAPKPQVVFQPNAAQAVDEVHVTRDRVAIELLENVKGVVETFALKSGAWVGTRLALPTDSALAIKAASRESNRLFVTSEGFLDPTSLWLADGGTGMTAKVKQLPPRFDASKDVVEQHFATSTDGTRIPYFLVRPKGMKFDGSTPTQMFGYGGFQIAEVPIYRPEMGKLWLERGAAYVLADIRGGGEFGPTWHDAALREHRQRAFDDFAAVAKDLIARKVTSPQHLGIYGRSNGGVLMSVSMTQHPELFGAVVIESPLIDMLRYNHLSAGASWVAEYGDPDVPADREFIAKYSGYQALKPGVKYPEPYITTNTEDDRVHPGHPRKFAAKLESLHDPYLFYENTFGGHANDADPTLNARRWARHYVYLWEKLAPQ
ncbi:prolyl oligopeptidase family protein [Caulobacter sp. S45]|uniref:prolyl oligopeptidase family serine peptidase n=1 Tax=Caulobacter sp. S45 TaxID=1641861 RepID=UPI00131C1A1D|nr:prolyl oligopeptidase family serine peptidase [Caulobacter sp. S45]